jgi:hypothetical protein
MSTWTPRNKRSNRYAQIGKFVSLGLALILAILIVIHYAIPYIDRLTTKKPAKSTSVARITGIKPTPASIDSLFRNAFADLNLQQIALQKTTTDSLGRQFGHPSYAALWPQTYPFVWLTLKIQANCHRYDSLYYDAIEIKNGKGLLLVLFDTKDTLGRLELTASDKPIAPAFSMAFIFDDFSNLRSDQIQKLAKLDLPFGYILKADQAPDKALATILRASKGQCILDIPTDEESWKIICRTKPRGKSGKEISIDKKAISAVLGQFPRLAAFRFDENNGIDRELVNALVSELERRSLTYIYDNPPPSYADSIVYANGLKISNFTIWSDSRGQTADKCRELILAKSNVLNSEDKGSFYLDSKPEIVALLSSISDLLKKLNVTIAPPLAKAQPVEKL